MRGLLKPMQREHEPLALDLAVIEALSELGPQVLAGQRGHVEVEHLAIERLDLGPQPLDEPLSEPRRGDLDDDQAKAPTQCATQQPV
ncbi:MAG TPA: hypothetical protein VM869_09235 [Enhygromyxa sp.]|nr:hypothetical protein [Enhygromyxa sp.]